ncbi:plasmid partitioning protein RepB [Pseudoruegeria sp. SK021]|uniref:plasmid partitioning protein RepB n=1 Tax=Pseudoruegeria sp. SK021 TaxID=1933035 RepID=UPI000A24B9F2|nr:plasmid partitioning protein RepB [Pseudoruegeria sp. SK021]OSP53433.1 plasmid partitioning protein RepB [Pseudoruegeria sp. SK021]
MARKLGFIAGLEGSTDTGTPRDGGRSKKARDPYGLVSSVNTAFSNALQDISPDIIDPHGPVDRLEDESSISEDQELLESIRQYGQLVPCLVRRSPDAKGRFQIVYGRRRLKACTMLDIPVKAIVRDLDDEQFVIAQGQENSARRDLSYFEKAMFAAAIEGSGYKRTVIETALNTSKGMVSDYLKVAHGVPDILRTMIGSAPGIGRDNWKSFVVLLAETPNGLERCVQAIRQEDESDSSERRFQRAVSALSKHPTPKTNSPREVQFSGGMVFIKESRRDLIIRIPKGGDQEKFAAWLSAKPDEILTELFRIFELEVTEE